MKLHHVLARLAKRVLRCDDVRAVFPGERAVPGKCPGWRIVDNASGKGARLFACQPCNDLMPSKLRVEDKDVWMIPAATQALRLRREQLNDQRRARRTTTHLRANYDDLVVLCGGSLGRTAGGRRTHRWTYILGEVTCSECRRLGQLTPAQRAAETQAKNAELRERFAAKNAALYEEQVEKRRAREELIAQARPEAMVALDLLETRTSIEGERLELFTRALRAAIVAYKHENAKSRGDRLWVFRDVTAGAGNQHCRFCNVRLKGGVTFGSDTSFAGQAFEVSDHTTLCALRYLAREYLPALSPQIDDRLDDGAEA